MMGYSRSELKRQATKADEGTERYKRRLVREHGLKVREALEKEKRDAEVADVASEVSGSGDDVVGGRSIIGSSVGGELGD